MTAPVAGWERTSSREPVYIPTDDGEGIAETIWIDVPAWKDPKTNMVFLDEEGREKIEAVKARHLGLLSPQQLQDLRKTIGLTQGGMASLLQLGQKSWTRWETGRERPSRSMNVLLCALYDGRIDVSYLQDLADPACRSQFKRWAPSVRFDAIPYVDCKFCVKERKHELAAVAA